MAMQVILQQNVEHLGKVGDVVKVKPGYARNFLLPNGLAAEASSRNVAQLAHQKRAADSLRSKIKGEAEKLQKAIEAAKVVLSRQVGEGDKLFGSVTSMDIESALRAQGLQSALVGVDMQTDFGQRLLGLIAHVHHVARLVEIVEHVLSKHGLQVHMRDGVLHRV